MKTYITLLASLCCLLSTVSHASAATRTVCFDLGFVDARFDCPFAGTNGARRTCAASGTQSAVGHVFEVWDKDPGDVSEDERIGTWHIGGAGEQCITFEWENASYSMGEAHPDVYLRYMNVVAQSGATSARLVSIRQANNTAYSPVNWRDGVAAGCGSADCAVAVNCQPGVSCRILPGTAMVPTNNVAGNYGQAILALDSAQRTMEIYNSRLDDGTIWIEHPTDESNCNTGRAINRTLVCLPSGLADDGDRATHELGHVLQMQEFNQNNLRNAITGGSWSATSQEYESGATTEGWAVYASVVAWWNPANTLAVPLYSGTNIELNTPINGTCNTNRLIPGQVAKSFWDLDDANNEAAAAPATGADGTNLATLTISAGWDNFADGTGNQQDYEWNNPISTPDGTLDVDAVNARDYDTNYNVNDTTFFNHNCLAGQSAN